MKKKNILALAIIIILLIALIVIVVLIINKKNNLNAESTDNQILKERVEQLVNNSYVIYYMLYGDVKLDDGKITLNNTTYRAINDELVVKTLEEYNSLLEDTFTDIGLEKILNNKEVNEYIEMNNTLFVKKIENPCQSITQLNLTNLRFNGDDKEKVVTYGDINSSIYIYNVDGQWKLSSTLNTCDAY